MKVKKTRAVKLGKKCKHNDKVHNFIIIIIIFEYKKSIHVQTDGLMQDRVDAGAFANISCWWTDGQSITVVL